MEQKIKDHRSREIAISVKQTVFWQSYRSSIFCQPNLLIMFCLEFCLWCKLFGQYNLLLLRLNQTKPSFDIFTHGFSIHFTCSKTLGTHVRYPIWRLHVLELQVSNQSPPPRFTQGLDASARQKSSSKVPKSQHFLVKYHLDPFGICIYIYIFTYNMYIHMHTIWICRLSFIISHVYRYTTFI